MRVLQHVEPYPPLEAALHAIRRIGATAVIAAVLAAGGVYIAAEHGPLGGGGGPPPGGGELSANIFVGANGSCTRSASLVAYNAATSCQEHQDACDFSEPGDIIGVEPGTYTDIEIHKNADCNGTAGFRKTWMPDNGVAFYVGDLTFGSPGGCTLDAPDYQTWDGGVDKNFVLGDMTHESGLQVCPGNTGSLGYTFRNMRIGNGMPTDSAVMQIRSPQSLVVEDNIVGPVCCGTTAGGVDNASPILLRIPLSSVGDPNPTDVTVQDNLFVGEARFCSDWNQAGWNTEYGACPRPTCVDTDVCHADTWHSYGMGGTFIFRRNSLPYYDVQALFMEEVNGGVNSANATIENNYFGIDLEGAYHAVWLSLGSGAVGNTFDIKFNTFTAGNGIDAGSSQGGQFGTTIVNHVGNLGGRLRNDTNACDGSTLQPTYAYNIWETTAQAWDDNCGATDAIYPEATIAGWLNVDGTLNSTSTPPNDFVQSGCIADDHDGDARSDPCDAGFDEKS